MTGIRSIEFTERFRGMSGSPFKACGLGKRTVIFGRNGSGKTTLSEAIRSEEALASYLWADPIVGPTGQRFVFNRFYVQDALAEFVEGDGSAAAILKVGSVNVRLARLEAEQVAVNERNVSWIQQAREATRALEREREAILRRAKTVIIDVLNSRDEVRFNSQAYTIRSVKAAFERKLGRTLEEDQFSTYCEVMGLRDHSKRIALADAPQIPPQFIQSTNELAAYDPVAASIDSLALDKFLARWVEQGLELHRVGDRCHFCASGTISGERLSELRGHFSDDLGRYRVQLQQRIDASKALIHQIDSWLSELPTVDAFEPGLRAEAQREITALELQVAAQRRSIESVVAALSDAVENPFADRNPLDLPLPQTDTTALNGIATRSNLALDSLSGRKRMALAAIEEHLVAPDHSLYREGFQRQEKLERFIRRLERVHERGVIRARSLHAEQQDTTAMAAEIDADLRAHFGHAHLEVAATPDGKGYVVQRNGVAARTLSEGERNAVALSYFLQSLHGADSALAEAVVVIDDPITSLDREAMFAAYALIEERTAKAGQLIVLTHDFEYFRLLLNGVSNRWGTSQKKIRAGDHTEEKYPAISVLEVRPVGTQGSRSTEIHPLPAVVVQRASEYHYLFWRIVRAIEVEDSDNLPLLGNAARRLIEGFISFKAPHGTTFQEKVDSVRDNYRVDPVLAKRVVKFLHGQSHREELRPTSATDFPTVEVELRNALEFIHQADSGHYRDMCKATSVENVFA